MRMKRVIAVGMLTAGAAIGVAGIGAAQAAADPWVKESTHASRADCVDAGEAGAAQGSWWAYRCDGPDGPGTNVLYVHAR